MILGRGRPATKRTGCVSCRWRSAADAFRGRVTASTPAGTCDPRPARPCPSTFMVMTSTSTSEVVGLDDEEAERRAASGRANVVDDATSRSVSAILRANVLTRFNALLGSLLVVILVVGPPQDALFGIVLVGNT